MRCVLINEFETTIASNKYSDLACLNIAEMDKDSLIQAFLDVYDYILTNHVDDVVFIAKNEKYSALTELFKKIHGGVYRFGIYIVPERFLKNICQENLMIEDIMYKIDPSKPRLSEFQVHLNDHCNLNCKGCGHFCPIVSEANYLDLSGYDSDLFQINQKFWGVGKIYLLGGEPLLHPQVCEFAEVTRKHFPDADIRLYTNGLLLDKQEDTFWEVIRQNNIHIEISVYQPTLVMFDKIEKVLREQDVWEDAIIWNNKQQFWKRGLLHRNGNKETAYEKCNSKSCHFLRNGYLALCPSVFMKEIFWDYYGMEHSYKPKDHAINLYDESITGEQIAEYLKTPNEACYYCGEPQLYDWDTRTKKTAEITDWAVDYVKG